MSPTPRLRSEVGQRLGTRNSLCHGPLPNLPNLPNLFQLATEFFSPNSPKRLGRLGRLGTA